MPILFSDSSSLTTAPAGGGQWTKASTTTLSGSSSQQEFTLDFSTYKQWKIVGENISLDQNESRPTGFVIKGTTAHSSGSSVWLYGATSGYQHYQKWKYTCDRWGNNNGSEYNNTIESDSDDTGTSLSQTGNFHNFEINTNDWSLTNGKSDAIPKFWGWWNAEYNTDDNDDQQERRIRFCHFSGCLTHQTSHSATHAQTGFKLDFATGQTGKTVTGKIYLYRRT